MKLFYFFLSLIFTLLCKISEANLSSSPRLSQHVEIFNGKSYFLIYEPALTWTEAQRACADEGLTLTKIESPEHLAFLVQLVNVTQGNGHAWIGATRLNRADFVWIDTEEPLPSYIWATTSEPNNSGGNETCVEVWVNGPSYLGANDKVESFVIPFICTTIDEPITTTTEQEETTTNSEPGFCSLPGFFPDPDDCQKYHVCVYNEVGDLWETVFTCAGDTVWCAEKTSCVDPLICPCSIQA